MEIRQHRSPQFCYYVKEQCIFAPFKTVYIPGHGGITYNEAADHLAGKAYPLGNITFHSSDISNRLNEKMALCCKPTQTRWSLKRLKEHSVKFGDGAKEKTRQAATKINVQNLMGVVSPHVLSQILRQGMARELQYLTWQTNTIYWKLKTNFIAKSQLLYMGCPLTREHKQKKNPIFIFKSVRVRL